VVKADSPQGQSCIRDIFPQDLHLGVVPSRSHFPSFFAFGQRKLILNCKAAEGFNFFDEVVMAMLTKV
jgi:hypothetical protein